LKLIAFISLFFSLFICGSWERAFASNEQVIVNGSCNIQNQGDNNTLTVVCVYDRGNGRETNPLAEDLFYLTSHGTYEYELENYRLAEAYFTYVINYQNLNASPSVFRGIARTALGDCSNAVQDFSNAIEVEPNKGAAYAYLGYLQAWYLGDVTSARRNFGRAKANIRDRAVHDEINRMLQAIDSQVSSGNWPRYCPSREFSSTRMSRTNLFDAIR